MLHIPKKWLAAATTLIGAAVAVPAFAAKDELITTTARGREEAIKDVPATISVLGQDDIENYGVQRVDDFVNLTPGVTLVNAAEVGDTQINIRGINGARDAENSIALVIDGILMTNPAAVNREYTNLQQIEVLKGSAGRHLRPQRGRRRVHRHDADAGRGTRVQRPGLHCRGRNVQPDR